MNKDTFIFDINKMMDFVFEVNDRTSDVEISETYVYDEETEKMVPQVKEVKEVKLNDTTNQQTIRYDLLKSFMEILDSIEDPKIMSLGQNIVFNTMQAYELIKDVKQNENE